VVPSDLIGYFTASSAVAGSLIGLLFVSISLRYEAILGSSADFRNRAAAAAAFTSLVNALTISLWALVPDSRLGYPAVVSALVCLGFTVRLHARKFGRGTSSLASFLLSVAVYLAQLVDGSLLIARPHSARTVFILAYTLFGAYASALSRSWQLLQPGHESAGTAEAASTAEVGTPPSASS
jgi:hypothetical protein